MGTSHFRVRIVLRAVASAMILWLAAVGFTKVGGGKLRSASLEPREIGLKDLDVATNSKEKVVAFGSRPPVDVNYIMSERRVPRGHDPIHNRDALITSVLKPLINSNKPLGRLPRKPYYIQ